MAYWWVHQNETFDAERDAGILWAPLLSSTGRRQRHWESLADVVFGDRVFHYRHGFIVAESIVTAAAVESKKPSFMPRSAPDWSDNGRLIRTTYRVLAAPIALDEIPLDWRKPVKDAAGKSIKGQPFNTHGAPNEGYLFSVRDDLAKNLTTKFSSRLPTGAESALAIIDQTSEDEPSNDVEPFDGALEQNRTVQTRGEQRTLRRRLLGGAQFAQCALCHETYPVRFIVAAHIKRRSQCSDAEKRDLPNVAMLACVFGCDALFEFGLIGVSANGKICTGIVTGVARSMKDRFDLLRDKVCLAHTPSRAAFFEWHLDNIFIKA